MKKILIVNNNMHLGGVQRALVSLLWSIADRYEVTLLLFYPHGECLKDLPPNVRVICLKSPYRCFGITKNDACGAWNRLCRSFYAALTRLFGRKYAVALMSLWQRKLKGFDVAVSYLHDAGERVFYGGSNDFVLRHVEAERKIAFLHCDYRRCGANTEENRKKYVKFDAIAACSGGCADSFLAAVPECKEKVYVVKNCHRFALIRKLAAQDPSPLPLGEVAAQRTNREGTLPQTSAPVGADAYIGPMEKQQTAGGRVDVGIDPYQRVQTTDGVIASEAWQSAVAASASVGDGVLDLLHSPAVAPMSTSLKVQIPTVAALPRNDANGTMWASSPAEAKIGGADSRTALGMTPSGCGARWDVEDAVPYESENRSADSHAALGMTQEAPDASGTTQLRILTVARLGKEKGVDRALRAIAALGEGRKNLQYDIIGDGIERPLLEKIIEDEHLSDCVRLLGALDNPYAHIASADLLLIPSNNEAAPLVIGEAACLGTPILSTETSSAREMIEQTGYGWVCENSEDGLTHALASLLAEPEKLRLVAKGLQDRNFDNKTALEQFDFLLQCKS